MSLIPEQWRQQVAAILEAAQLGTIIVTIRARHDWRNLDNEHYESGLYSLLAEELRVSGAIYGKRHTMDEAGECYSFTFLYQPPSATGPITLYAKLNLLPDGQVVIIYSAHT